MATTIAQIDILGLGIFPATIELHHDPGAEFVETDASPAPVVAPPTEGPHRYTIHVPHDDASTFSIGQACPDRINDTGITGRTKTHIHFETTETAPTIVSLGGGSEDSLMFSVDSSVLDSSLGYVMLTHEVAWSESTKKTMVASQQSDINLRTLTGDRHILLQADDGFTDVLAGKSASTVGKTVNIVARSAPQFDDVLYAGEVSNQVPDTHGIEGWAHKVEWAAIASTAADCLVEAYTMAGHGHYKKTQPNSFRKVDAAAAAHIAATAARITWTGTHMVSLGGETQPAGAVKISSQTDTGIMAGGAAVVYGQLGATLGSVTSATVVAPLATLEGLVFAGVAGKHTACMGLIGAELVSPLGHVFIEGKKDVEIASHGHVNIGAHHHVFMRSDEHAFMYGGHSAYLGAGDGWGVIANEDGVKLGSMANAANFDTVSLDMKSYLWLYKDRGIKMLYERTGLHIEKDKVKILTNGHKAEITLTDDIAIDASKINIG